MTTVTIGETGEIGLPEEVLNESNLRPGSELVVLAHKGSITLIDRERFEKVVSRPIQKMLADLKQAREENPQAPFFGGLTYEEYAALSDEEDKALWDRLYAEAEREVKIVERDVPAHFRPAGQKRR